MMGKLLEWGKHAQENVLHKEEDLQVIEWNALTGLFQEEYKIEPQSGMRSMIIKWLHSLYPAAAAHAAIHLSQWLEQTALICE